MSCEVSWLVGFGAAVGKTNRWLFVIYSLDLLHKCMVKGAAIEIVVDINELRIWHTN